MFIHIEKWWGVGGLSRNFCNFAHVNGYPLPYIWQHVVYKTINLKK